MMQRNNLFYTNSISTVNNDLVFRDSITGGNVGYIDRITTEIDPYTGFSAEITVTNKKAYDQLINLYMGGSREAEHVTPKKYQIKRVVANPSKNATTVIFEDGTVEVVKKSPDDPEADIFSVVAYAVAKRIYGTNSAFKREVLKNLDFIDRDFEKIIDRTSCEDLAKAMRKVVEYIKNKNRKEDDNDA